MTSIFCEARECKLNDGQGACGVEQLLIDPKGKCACYESGTSPELEIVCCIYCHRLIKIPKQFENQCPICGETFYTPSFKREAEKEGT